ncbi:MAG: hypothetical protein ACTIDI_04805 [Pseudolactococcus laudensis]
MSEDASGFVCSAGKIPEWLCGCSGVLFCSLVSNCCGSCVYAHVPKEDDES